MFVINGKPKDIGGFPESKDAAPEGGETAYVDTWALGKLKPGEEKTFRWSVTAVRAWRLQARVQGGRRAGRQGEGRGRGRRRPRGEFAGTISEARPVTRVGDDGQTIVQGTPGGL